MHFRGGYLGAWVPCSLTSSVVISAMKTIVSTYICACMSWDNPQFCILRALEFDVARILLCICRVRSKKEPLHIFSFNKSPVQRLYV